MADVVYKTVIKNRSPGEPPVILESTLLTIVAQRNQLSQMNNTKLGTTKGTFHMPSLETVVGDTTNISYVDTKVMLTRR